MTGFGAALAQRDGLSVRAEVRSVNHRHLQIKTRLPGEFAHLEPDVEQALRKRIQRGAVSATVTIARQGAADAVELNPDVAQRYQRHLKRLAKELDLPLEYGLLDIANLPGVLTWRSEVEAGEKEARLVRSAVADATDGVLAMREREGASLAADLRRNAAAIERLLARIEKRMPRVVEQHHKNLAARIRELVDAPQAVSERDLARELALIADRVDVSEETTRLRSHLEQLGRVLDKGGTVGRQLDFLTQEFFREANTTGAKCNDAQVAHLVVELKTHIERLREQVQNVE